MPTRSKYIDYALSLVGYYGAGAGGRENDVPFNTKYYGKHVSGSNWSWCRVFEWFVDDHFGLAALNGGKSAYVPANVHGKDAKVWHKPRHGSDAFKTGNKVNFDFNRTGEAEHTGFFWKPRDSKSFWTVEGNTGNDQVAKRIRYYADVLDVLETLGLDDSSSSKPPTKKGNDVPDYVSLTTEKGISVQPDKEFFVKFNKELSDKAGRHSDAGTEGICVGGKNGSVYTCQVEFNGPGTWALCEMAKDKDGNWQEQQRNTTGGIDLLNSDSHLWLKVTPHSAGEVTVTVKTAIWDR